MKAGGIGVTGYCMGGLMALTAAGTFPERIVAAASFHGGRLATDAPDSPHLLAPEIKARVYVAGAIEDASFPDEMKQRLELALTDAGVEHVVETYPAKHGWVFNDTPVYDAAACERHWARAIGAFRGDARQRYSELTRPRLCFFAECTRFSATRLAFLARLGLVLRRALGAAMAARISAASL